MLHEGRPAVPPGREGAEHEDAAGDPEGTAADSDARVTQLGVWRTPGLWTYDKPYHRALLVARHESEREGVHQNVPGMQCAQRETQRKRGTSGPRATHRPTVRANWRGLHGGAVHTERKPCNTGGDRPCNKVG